MKKSTWENVRVIARSLGRPEKTIGTWEYRGFVPAIWHAKLIAKARKLGIELTYEDLTGV